MSEPIIHQPRLSEDRSLDEPFGLYYYSVYTDLVERWPEFLEYPETRAFVRPTRFDPVFPDEFIGLDAAGHGIPNNTMPEPQYPDRILGGQFVDSGNAFDAFLGTLRQRCRNYNLDLYKLRQLLFALRATMGDDAKGRDRKQERKAGVASAPLEADPQLQAAITAFNTSADRLSEHLRRYDPLFPDQTNATFDNLVVEFVKINGYIASIRAGATEHGTGHEVEFSSSSHISISSMFSSSYP